MKSETSRATSRDVEVVDFTGFAEFRLAQEGQSLGLDQRTARR